MTLSTSRFAKFKDEIEKLKDGLVMKNLSETRWIGRAESIKAVWSSYDILIALMEDMSSEDMRASNILMQLKSVDFYVSLVPVNIV